MRPGFEPQPSESPESLGTAGLTALFPSPVTGQKTALTTCLTTVVIILYPGVAQLVARLLWEQDAGSSSLPTRTKTPQNPLILRSFSLFLLQNNHNAFKHFPAGKLASSKAVKACLMTGFPPCFLAPALRLEQSISRITRFEF